MDATKQQNPTILGPTSYCRLCLKTESIISVIQSPDEGYESLLSSINECLGIWLAVNEDFPFAICRPCSMSLEAIRQFRYNCQQCDLYLRSQRATSTCGLQTTQTQSTPLVMVEPSDVKPYHLVSSGNGHETRPMYAEGIHTHTEQQFQVIEVARHPPAPATSVSSDYDSGSTNGQSIQANQYYNSNGGSSATPAPAEEQPAAPVPIPAATLKKFDCPECGKQLFSSRSLAQHVVREHRLCHGCDVCGMAYTSESKLADHKQSCAGRPAKFLCNQCPSGKVFATAISLSMHLYYAHESIESVVYRCEACKKNFKNRIGLKYHYSARHGCTMVECEICRRPFPTEESLYYHKQADH